MGEVEWVRVKADADCNASWRGRVGMVIGQTSSGLRMKVFFPGLADPICWHADCNLVPAKAQDSWEPIGAGGVGAVKRAFIAGHIAGSGYAGWWSETATPDQRAEAAREDWEKSEVRHG